MRSFTRSGLLGSFAVTVGLAGCTATQSQGPEPTTPQTSSVRVLGSVGGDQSARIGTQNAAQSFTPTPTPKALRNAVRTKWKAQVGRTDAHTSMELAGGRVVISAADGVHVLDALTGERRALVRSPDGSAIRGAAADGDALFFTTARGLTARASFAGDIAWSFASGVAAGSGPALADVNGDGVRDAIVGTAGGNVVAIDGKSGKKLWQTYVGGDGHRGIEAGVAVGDVDKDGKDEIVAGSAEGTLAILRSDGTLAWKTKLSSRIAAPPTLADLDAHGGLEILAAWADGRVAIFDGNGGDPLWSAQLERDTGELDTITAAPVALPAGPNVGFVLVATAGGTKRDGLVVLGEHERRFRSIEGQVTGTPVVLRLDPSSMPDAVVATQAGDVIGLDARGGRTLLGSVGGPVDASPLATDIDGDGVRDLLVVTRDGAVTCWSTGVAEAPLVERYRGPHAPVNLGWTFVRGRNDERVLKDRLDSHH